MVNNRKLISGQGILLRNLNLARSGYGVSKYLRFDPVKDVIPCLMRRAQENSSVSGQTGREPWLIKKEMKKGGI